MNILKRVALLVFGVAGLFCLVALSLPWVGPFTKGAAALLYLPWYFALVQVAVVITAVGAVLALLRGILTPRNAKTVLVGIPGGDQITVSTSAIASQAAHIVEQEGDYLVQKVRVSASHHKVNVRVRVRPAYAIDVTQEGAHLHEALIDGLSTICGKAINRVTVEFSEPESLEPRPLYEDYDESDFQSEADSPASSTSQSFGMPFSFGGLGSGGQSSASQPAITAGEASGESPALAAPAEAGADDSASVETEAADVEVARVDGIPVHVDVEPPAEAEPERKGVRFPWQR